MCVESLGATQRRCPVNSVLLQKSSHVNLQKADEYEHSYRAYLPASMAYSMMTLLLLYGSNNVEISVLS